MIRKRYPIYIQLIIAIPTIALIIYLVHILESTRKANIRKDCTLILSELYSISPGGEAFGPSVRYGFYVDGVEFMRTIEISSRDTHHFKYFERFFGKDLVDKYAWVIYSNNDPEESLVDLRYIFNTADTLNLLKPDTFDHFY